MPQQQDNDFDFIVDPFEDNLDDEYSIIEEELFSDTGHSYIEKTIEDLYKKRYGLNTTLRIWLAGWAAFIVTGWLVFVLIIIFKNDKEICLSDSVMITLLTTTTVNIIGIMTIVMYDLFNGKSEKMRSKSTT